MGELHPIHKGIYSNIENIIDNLDNLRTDKEETEKILLKKIELLDNKIIKKEKSEKAKENFFKDGNKIL